MVVLQNNNGCRMCPKVFCCSDCRDAHESSKHPKSECSLCLKSSLVFDPQKRPASLYAELVPHVAAKHLPLHCKLCGNVYSSDQDLTLAEKCRWWEQRGRKQERESAPADQEDPKQKRQRLADKVSAAVAGKPAPVPLTPQLLITRLEATSAVSRLKQNNLDSPPTEVVRLTSTPVHGLEQPSPKQGSLHFALTKTPNSFDKCTFESSSSDGASAAERSSLTETRYYTGPSSLPDIDGSFAKLNLLSIHNKSGCKTDSSCASTPYRSILKNHLEPMSTDAESKSNGLSRISDSIEKRVRFSDECPVTNSSADDSFADDIFFEARETLDDSHVAQDTYCKVGDCNTSKNELTSNTCCNDTSRDKNYNYNDSNNCLEKKPLSAGSPVVTSTTTKMSTMDGNIGSHPTASATSSSKRVVMMLVVEQTDSKSFSTQELHSIIDSGLKEFEKKVDPVHDQHCLIQECSESGGSRIMRYSTEVSNSQKVDVEKSVSSNGTTRRSIRRNSCINVTECYSESPTGQLEISNKEVENRPLDSAESSEVDDSVGKSDGIFSVMARVVRSALNKLPVQAFNHTITGSMSTPLPGCTQPLKSLSREPVPQALFTPAPSNPQQQHSHLVCSPVAFSSPCTTMQRSHLKRPRDRLDSTDEASYASPRHSPGSGSNSNNGSGSEIVHSPALKRYRGRFRIRARQPIARMRQYRQHVASPRGTSLETQRFQQGSLTVRDTLLPLPSRAHQSTQTEQ